VCADARPDGRPFTGSAIRRRAQRFWAAAGIDPIGLHEARHTCASTWIAAGVNAKALSTYLGHANISVTFDRCGHLIPGGEDAALALIDAFYAAATDTRTDTRTPETA
jgi:integrase